MVKILYLLYRCDIGLCKQTSTTAFDTLWIVSCEYIEFIIHNGSKATLDVCVLRRIPQRYNKYRILTILYDFIYYFTSTAKNQYDM
jgi:hypothetical protein